MPKFKVKLMRVTRDYVEILVDEDDVTDGGHASDFVNNQLTDPDWDPTEKCIDDSGYADVDQPFEVLDVEPYEEPEVTRLPVVTREEGNAALATGNRLVLPKGVSPEQFAARMKELDESPAPHGPGSVWEKMKMDEVLKD